LTDFNLDANYLSVDVSDVKHVQSHYVKKNRNRNMTYCRSVQWTNT